MAWLLRECVDLLRLLGLDHLLPERRPDLMLPWVADSVWNEPSRSTRPVGVRAEEVSLGLDQSRG